MKSVFLGIPVRYQLSGNGAVSYNSHGINFITYFRPNKDIKDWLNAASFT